jgi:hypothetical protein
MLSFLLDLHSRLDDVLAVAWSPARKLLVSSQLSDRLLFTILSLLFSGGVFLFQYALVLAVSRTNWWQRKRIRGMKLPPADLLAKALKHDLIMHWVVRYVKKWRIVCYPDSRTWCAGRFRFFWSPIR